MRVLVVSLIAICSTACDQGKQAVLSISQVYETISHNSSDGIALSGDARLIAGTFVGQARNTITIVDTHDDSRLLLEDTDKATLLHQPAFSMDGQLLAFVASPAPPYQRSSIIVFDLSAERVAWVLGNDEIDRRNPAFVESNELIFWRERDSSPPAQARIGEAFAFSLYQTDIGGQSENRFSSFAYSSPGKIFPSANGKLLFNAAGELVKRSGYAGGPAEVWEFGRGSCEFGLHSCVVSQSRICETPAQVNLPDPDLQFDRMFLTEAGRMYFYGARADLSGRLYQVSENGVSDVDRNLPVLGSVAGVFTDGRLCVAGEQIQPQPVEKSVLRICYSEGRVERSSYVAASSNSRVIVFSAENAEPR